MGKRVDQAIGNVGADPEDGTTSVGPVTRFSLAVTKEYPSSVGIEDGKTVWLSVAVFKESIREQVKAHVGKGTRVAVEGVITQSEYQGKPQFGMKASRVGLVEWFLPSAEDKAKAAARAAKAAPAAKEEEELSW